MPSLTKSYFEFSLIFKFLMRKALSHVNSLKAVQSLKNYLYSFLYKAWRQIEVYLYKTCLSSGSCLGKKHSTLGSIVPFVIFTKKIINLAAGVVIGPIFRKVDISKLLQE